ncbi:hypothetical protein PENSTE_c023G04571 [Penicillium steckii]|uniref:Uncharacterized protein n=1 Tax=Penicillium steckii TaxID=303698 RepID=A0A1V6SRQ3_9EURO|nr:hypothetical protein PENSTE_c023G04571 [Penicillium steckii]
MGRRRRASSISQDSPVNINIRAPLVESSTAIISRAIAKLNECMTAYSQEKLQTDAAFNGNATTIMKLLADPHPDLNDLLAHGFPARASSALDQKHNELRAILAELLAHGRNQPATR